jgi:hypothetical protein
MGALDAKVEQLSGANLSSPKSLQLACRIEREDVHNDLIAQISRGGIPSAAYSRTASRTRKPFSRAGTSYLWVPKMSSGLKVPSKRLSLPYDCAVASFAGYGDDASQADVAAGSGKRSTAPATDRLAPQGEGAAQIDQRGPVVPRFPVSMVPFDPERDHCHPPGNIDPMASIWRWKSRRPAGRPKLDAELRSLITRMSVA